MIKKNHITAAALAGAMIFSMIPAGSAFAKTSYTYKPLKEVGYTNIGSKKSPKWIETSTYKYTYDKKGRILSADTVDKSLDDNPGYEGRVAWTYKRKSTRTYSKNTITTKYYNNDGTVFRKRVITLKKGRIQKVVSFEDGQKVHTDKFTYNSKGLNTKITTYSRSGELYETITMTYNSKKQMTKRVSKNIYDYVTTEGFTYWSNGNLKHSTEKTSDGSVTCDYNKSGQVIKAVDKDNRGTSTTKTTYYKSGKAKGLIASKTTTFKNKKVKDTYDYTFKKLGGKYYVAQELYTLGNDSYKIIYSNFKKMPVYDDIDKYDADRNW